MVRLRSPQLLRPCELDHSNWLGSCGAGGAILEEGNQLGGIAGWRKTGLAAANQGERFAGGEMGESFLQGAREIGERGSRRDSNNGFSKTEDAMCGGFESLGGGIVRFAGDDDLQRMVRKECGGKSVGGGE